MAEPFKQNPIDKDKVAENPGLLPYAHHVGGVPIVPTQEGIQRSSALSSMDFQTDLQLGQIKEQMELLAEQARSIQKRKQVSEWIYNAKISFKPEVNHVYHLYEREDGSFTLSLLSPEEFALSLRQLGRFVHTIRLLGDHTWHIER
ncbi:MAG: DUF2452 domain-containing protein [Schleiferiaceae bacterium]|nr:DUF2452 domain-containing protein [Schleiferiaceae bacterium]